MGSLGRAWRLAAALKQAAAAGRAPRRVMNAEAAAAAVAATESAAGDIRVRAAVGRDKSAAAARRHRGGAGKFAAAAGGAGDVVAAGVRAAAAERGGGGGGEDAGEGAGLGRANRRRDASCWAVGTGRAGVYSLAYKQPAGDQAQIKADGWIDGWVDGGDGDGDSKTDRTNVLIDRLVGSDRQTLSSSRLSQAQLSRTLALAESLTQTGAAT